MNKAGQLTNAIRQVGQSFLHIVAPIIGHRDSVRGDKDVATGKGPNNRKEISVQRIVQKFAVDRHAIGACNVLSWVVFYCRIIELWRVIEARSRHPAHNENAAVRQTSTARIPSEISASACSAVALTVNRTSC